MVFDASAPQTYRSGMNRLRELMDEAGISGAELARRVGAQQPEIWRLVNFPEGKNSRKMTIEWAERLAPALGVNPADLLFSDNVASTPEDERGAEAAPLLAAPGAIKLSREDFVGVCRRLIHRLDVMGITGQKAATDVGIPAERIQAFWDAAMDIEGAELPAIDPVHMDALATRLGTNLDWLLYHKGDENFCKEPLALQEVFRMLKESGPETWQQVRAFLDAVKVKLA